MTANTRHDDAVPADELDLQAPDDADPQPNPYTTDDDRPRQETGL